MPHPQSRWRCRVTLMTAFALLDYNVTHYDRAADILWLRSASWCLLHSHIYEWPRLGLLDERAGLPFLDRVAGPGKDVVADLRAQLPALRARLPKLLFEYGKVLRRLPGNSSSRSMPARKSFASPIAWF